MANQSALPPLLKSPAEQTSTLIAALILLIPMLEAAINELLKNEKIKSEAKKILLASLSESLMNAKKILSISRDELKQK